MFILRDIGILGSFIGSLMLITLPFFAIRSIVRAAKMYISGKKNEMEKRRRKQESDAFWAKVNADSRQRQEGIRLAEELPRQ